MAPASKVRHASAELITFDRGEDSQLAYSLASGRVATLPSVLVSILSRCRTFKTLDDHVEAIYRSVAQEGSKKSFSRVGEALRSRLGRSFRSPSQAPQESKKERALLKKLLTELAERGFLTSDTDILTQASASAELSNGTCTISSLALVTSSRAQVLGRAVSSFGQNARKFDRTPTIIVLDDSRQNAALDANIAALASAKEASSCRIAYAGPKERRAFARSLTALTALNPELLDFGLFGSQGCPISDGAARNSVLLATAGECLAVVDDDMICRLARAPEIEPGLALSSNDDSAEVWFFRDYKAASRSATFVEQDFLGLHEMLLGQDLEACVSAYEKQGLIELHSISARLERALRHGGGRVGLTATGIIGDSGAGSTGYFALGDSSRKRLLTSESAYRQAVETRQVFRTVRRKTISDNPSIGNLGIDNRALMPPFLPIQRNSDGIFGKILGACFPQVYFGYLPWGLAHVPLEQRAQSFDALWADLGRVQTSHILDMLLGSFPGVPRGMAAGTGLRRLGLFLSDMGSMDLDDFEEVLRIQAWHAGSWQISQIERRLEDRERTPKFFAKYLHRYVDIVRESQLKREFIIPRDLWDIHGKEEARKLSKRLVHQFGELLQVWPDLVAAAKELRGRGVFLARPL